MHNIFSTYKRVKPRILLVEDDASARIPYQMLLMDWGYEPILAMGRGAALQEDARLKAQEKRCSLALIDLRLIDNDDDTDVSGLNLALDLKQDFPIIPIILSGYESVQVYRTLQNYPGIPFIGKQDRRSDFQKKLDDVSAAVCASKREIEFVQTDILDEFMQSDLAKEMGEYPDQIVNVLVRMFPKAKTLRFERLVAPDTTVSSATRPNSIVLKVYEDDLEACVVKMARAAKIQKEAENFRKFISRKLTGGFNPQQLGKEELAWDIGGIAYTYEGGKNAITFTNYYKERGLTLIKGAMSSFFLESWKRYYTPPTEEPNTSLHNLYKKIWGEEWFEKCSKEISNQTLERTRETLQHYNLPQPVEWLANKIAQTHPEFSPVNTLPITVIHGDLHGDNLLVDNKNIVWVIDFERCGWGYTLQDFIELETDILSRLQGHDVTPLLFYKMCLTLFKQSQISEIEEAELPKDEQIAKAAQSISALRGIAVKCTKNANIREYLMGLLFNMIFKAALSHKEDPQKSERPLIIAGFLCHRLDHWGEPWPPAEWNLS
ncbi:MAG: phosphotransferase [Chloroflexi bacterium]|nr:phosphotransferase [Chloroflexota bacterium]